MNNPYQNLPATQYWKTGVADQHPSSIENLYRKKFPITAKTAIATAGSCFAQHIGGNLRRNGYQVLDMEPAPSEMSDSTAKQFGYGIYSARYGNIYSARQLLQLIQDALELCIREDISWIREGRYFDALRPSVEPEGLSCEEEVKAHRLVHLERVARMIKETNLFVFTLGLTEAWVHKATGTVYPTAPGTIAGQFDSEIYEFKNFSFREVLQDMLDLRKLIRTVNPKIKFLLTVSPVPLTATASSDHVLVATTYSKSVLRAVAGELAQRFPDVDYFPSYEIIASSFARGFFYSSNLRSVEPAGVEAVMRVFFSQHQLKLKSASYKKAAEIEKDNELVCEEILLEAFSK